MSEGRAGRTTTMALAAAAVLLETLIGFGLPSATPGLSLAHDYVSAAGAVGAPFSRTFQLLGAVAAALHTAAVLRMRNAWRERPLGPVTVWLFAGFFLVIGASMAFRCDPHCAMMTTEAKIHNVMGWLAFLSLGFAGLASIASHVRAPRPGSRLVAAIAMAMVALALLLLSSAVMGILRGATERATIIAMIAWTGAWLRQWDAWACEVTVQ